MLDFQYFNFIIMAIFSFFNSKGGSGKSAHSLLFGSYLAYSAGARVCILDFEFEPRLERIRKKEEEMLSDKDSALARYIAAHPGDSVIGSEGVLDIVSVSKDFKHRGDRTEEEFDAAVAEYLDGVVEKYDYVIVDLPGEFREDSLSFSVLVSSVDLVAVPFDYTPTVRNCALHTAEVMRDNDVPLVMFWNKVSVSDLKKDGFLDRIESFLTDRGYDVLPHRVKFFQKAMREYEGGKGFVVSTLCWPRRYVELNCPVLEILYACLKGRLDEITD